MVLLNQSSLSPAGQGGNIISEKTERQHSGKIGIMQLRLKVTVVRAGVARNLSEWVYGGYHEIQNPKQRFSLINHKVLAGSLGISDGIQLAEFHWQWVEEVLKNSTNKRGAKWSESIAVGDKEFVSDIKSKLGSRAIGREITGAGDGEYYELRGPQTSSNPLFAREKAALRP
jgi:putative transposase